MERKFIHLIIKVNNKKYYCNVSNYNSIFLYIIQYQYMNLNYQQYIFFLKSQKYINNNKININSSIRGTFLKVNARKKEKKREKKRKNK